MFKALLAASLAMLVCCVAAAWAGPVPPASDPFVAAPAFAASHPPSPLHLIDVAPQQEKAPALLDAPVINGFVPVSFSGASPAGAPPLMPAAPDESALPDSAVRSAVIPLPTPLYAALALLAIAVVSRRAILRVC